ncbi:hypothetical protein ASPZODRAFT_849409 [Penicilliopsis zonata CBS 506.65]|uniref:CENP-C homolog n=1 Tax=Penicilliopsis zonata CBS 506.65 TaxID=1073090 RepID=A0A1L9SAH6_9EURO|nr:hypothetical protein ASPZODRAFT_849409 [Penicilliopsis zonata CBS 506.65]OJJ44190.1 hypothetical protein ASPZODRAFT_849409 [Penicilliopsis zonata CBS 506.65]
MAPRGPAKARDYDYSNVGTAGRRTGITLKEGKIDEYGMEDLDGMFSSPEKSPVNYNGFDAGDETSIGSDGMSMDEGNAPDPSEFLTSTNGGRGTYFLPPVARSPVKTGLTGSPRRTPGLRSSPIRRNEDSSSAEDNHDLTIDNGESQQDMSPLGQRSVNAQSVAQPNGIRNKTKKTKGSKALEPEVTNVTAGFSDSDADSQLQGDENGNVFNQIQNELTETLNNGDETTGDDQLLMEPDAPDYDDSDAQSPSIVASDLRKMKKPISESKRNGAGDSRRTRTAVAQEGSVDIASQPKRKRPGRPSKNARNVNSDLPGQRPTKKTKMSEPKDSTINLPHNPELDKIVENYAMRTGPLKGRSLYILKREMPSDDSTTHTRSGRASVRPLAYWRNERCVYGDGEADVGQRFPLSTIKEIIRTEELESDKKKSGKHQSSKKGRPRKNRDDDSDIEGDSAADPWEKEGILHGYIRKWDQNIQASTEDEEVLDIAYAPSGIETRGVKNSSFRFAKLLSSSFIGSGIVELGPGGVKKPKNSKKMHMVFYVCHGRVQVDVSGVQFSAGKGCVFQVPRGNYYSFANTHQKDARLFFTQGCVPAPNEVSTPGSASKLAENERESTAEATPAVTTVKGRPRGKQKVNKA